MIMISILIMRKLLGCVGYFPKSLVKMNNSIKNIGNTIHQMSSPPLPFSATATSISTASAGAAAAAGVAAVVCSECV